VLAALGAVRGPAEESTFRRAFALVGPDVLDRVLGAWLCENPQIFPESYRRAGRQKFFRPERRAPLEAELADRGYPVRDIAAIMGGNFLRVARQVWKPGSDSGQPEMPKAQLL
jgi:hypothetical protein